MTHRKIITIDGGSARCGGSERRAFALSMRRSGLSND